MINDTQTNYTSVVEISCDLGYYLVGESVVECHYNSSWSSRADCEIYGKVW